MTDNKEYLPQYTLNQLSDRVAMKVDHFKRLFRADKVWDNIIGLCQKIEEEPRNVSTVIINLKKENVIAVSDTKIRWYHVNLTLIYIILYYRKGDDDAYKNVFSQIIKNMGYYADDKILKNKIQQEILDIKEEDKLWESKKSNSKNNSNTDIAADLNKERKNFILAINTGLIKNIDSVDWADATLGFEKDVMTELFWGIEDDKTLKKIVNNIINTWNKLVKTNDNRCKINYNGNVLSAIASIKVLKFDKALNESIEKFFEDLWLKRNARNTYCSVKEVILQQQQSNSADLEIIESLKAKVEKLENENTELKDINTSQEARLAESEKSATLAVEIEEILIELLTPIFNKDSDIARTFINEVRDCDDIEIVKITGRYVKETKVSTSFIYRPLWRLLHAFRIYNSGERNWNTTLKSRINIKKS